MSDLTAAHNLALDAALFQSLEAGARGECFRLWESPEPAVVLGRGGVVSRDVHEAACAADGVPVLRRASGGGAVLLGRGCLVFSLLLSLDRRPELRNVRASYSLILGSLIRALAVPGLEIEGPSDLAIGGRKVSGNAQRRGQHALLHHGTLLYGFDPRSAEKYLRPPVRQPEYRSGRSHAEFLNNLPLSCDDIKVLISQMSWIFPSVERLCTHGESGSLASAP